MPYKNSLFTLSSWTLNARDHQLIDLAFEEDFGVLNQDLTTQLLFGDDKKTLTGHVVSKHPDPIVISGLPVAKALLKKFGWESALESSHKDGEILRPGTTLLSINAPANVLLMLERLLLNFLQHMSSIATHTATYVNQVKHTRLRILDTRKTLPGHRHLQKYAVACGGGVNHRMGLYDALMIKDTHIDLKGGIEAALASLPLMTTQQFPVIVEVRNRHELTLVLEKGLDKISRILLDNMTLPQLNECVRITNQAVPLEVSGNINPHTIVAIAETGVDYASIGRLTHSPGHVDLSMRCNKH